MSKYINNKNSNQNKGEEIMETKKLIIADFDTKNDHNSAMSKFFKHLYGIYNKEISNGIAETINSIETAKNKLMETVSLLDENEISYTDSSIINLIDICEELTDMQENLAEFGVLSYHR